MTKTRLDFARGTLELILKKNNRPSETHGRNNERRVTKDHSVHLT